MSQIQDLGSSLLDKVFWFLLVLIYNKMLVSRCTLFYEKSAEVFRYSSFDPPLDLTIAPRSLFMAQFRKTGSLSYDIYTLTYYQLQ